MIVQSSVLRSWFAIQVTSNSVLKKIRLAETSKNSTVKSITQGFQSKPQITPAMNWPKSFSWDIGQYGNMFIKIVNQIVTSFEIKYF